MDCVPEFQRADQAAPNQEDPMKTGMLLAAIGLSTTMLALEIAAAKPGRPEALTRGISVNEAALVKTAAAERMAVQIGRPAAMTRGLGIGVTLPPTASATRFTPEQKPGKPEYHTRGIYCPHRGRRG
jgi:hypothetical protein